MEESLGKERFGTSFFFGNEHVLLGSNPAEKGVVCPQKYLVNQLLSHNPFWLDSLGNLLVSSLLANGESFQKWPLNRTVESKRSVDETFPTTRGEFGVSVNGEPT